MRTRFLSREYVELVNIVKKNVTMMAIWLLEGVFTITLYKNIINTTNIIKGKSINNSTRCIDKKKTVGKKVCLL